MKSPLLLKPRCFKGTGGLGNVFAHKLTSVNDPRSTNKTTTLSHRKKLTNETRRSPTNIHGMTIHQQHHTTSLDIHINQGAYHTSSQSLGQTTIPPSKHSLNNIVTPRLGRKTAGPLASRRDKSETWNDTKDSWTWRQPIVE